MKHDAHVRLFRARHPGDLRTVMVQYRRHILTCKRKWGSARSLIQHRAFIESYLWAKSSLLAASRG